MNKDEQELNNKDLYKDTGLKVGQLRRHQALKPVRLRLNEKYGEGVWGLDEVAADLLETQARNTKRDSPSTSTESRRVVGKGLSERLKEYLRHFPDPTPNDLASLERLCSMEMMIEEVVAIRDSLDRGKGFSVDDFKKLGELEIKYTTEHRQLQTILGIDRAQRDSHVDPAAELKRIVSGASEFLETRVIKITCPHCFKERKLNQGFINFPFRSNVPFRWWSICPNIGCGKEIVIEGGPQ